MRSGGHFLVKYGLAVIDVLQPIGMLTKKSCFGPGEFDRMARNL